MAEYWGIVPAAGRGDRFKAGMPKQYLHVVGSYLIDHSLAALWRRDLFGGTVVSLAEDDVWWQQTRSSQHGRVITCRGGISRAQSVMNALRCLSAGAFGEVTDDDWVLVHDAVRPCLSEQDLSALIESLSDDEVGGLLAAPGNDTLKLINADAAGSRVVCSLERGTIMRALTPQMFRFGLLYRALDAALKKDIVVYDEAQAMELAGHGVRIVAGDGANVKLTYAHELPQVEAWLRSYGQSA